MKPSIDIKIFLLIATSVLLAACGERSEPKYRIGFAQCSGDYWREKTNQDMRLELLNHPALYGSCVRKPINIFTNTKRNHTVV